jgi:perosamine synthetase
LTADEGRVRLNQEVFQNPHYKRHDVLGWNYRLAEFNAAIALAQLERINVIVAARVASANYLMDVMRLCDYLIPQTVPKDCFNSYYTLGAIYEGKEAKGVSWEDFRKKYIKNGGDGIYGAWSVPYQEPLMKGYEYVGFCPVAESIQPKLMQFKTNYTDMKLAERKAEALWKTITELK